MVEDMKVRKGYKKTEIGVIPEDWECMKLENVLNSVQLGGNYKNSENKTSFPLIKMGNLDRGRIKLTKIEYVDNTIIPSERDKLKYGDVLLNTRNTPELVGKTSIWRNELSQAYFNLNILRFNFDNSYISSTFFMNYILNTNQSIEQLRDFATGTTSVAAIYTRDLMNLKIAIPPLEEQKTIAKALTDTDNLIYSIEKLIDKKEKIKKGTMQELLTGKKRLDGFSGEWGNKSLYELVEFINGKAHENFISDIGKYIVVNSRFVSTEGNVIKYSYQGNCLALTNDILMVMSDVPNGRAIAKCYYVEEDNRYTINQRVCILRSKDIISKFLFYVVDRNSHYLSFDDGVKQTNLKRDDVLNLNIKVPPLNEQKAISQAISDMDQEIQVLTRKLEKYKTIKQGMMQELLTGRIRLI